MEAKLIMTVEEMKNRENWLKLRNSGIGGSDAAIAVGLSRWKSPFQLWLEKTGQSKPEDLSDNEYIYWGTVLEQVVADRFCEVTGKKVHRQGMMQNVKNPWMLANVDRMVVGENTGLECKTANGFAAKEWEDDKIPDAYYCQCQHYMMATGCSKWYIACLIGGNHFVWKAIERNEADIAALYQAEAEFWEHVEQMTMPPLDGSDSCAAALKEKFQGGRIDPINLPEESIRLLEMIDSFKEKKKTVESTLKETENKLCLLLGDNEIGYAGDRKITWKVQNGRITVDSKKLKTELPDVYAQYSKVGKPTRVLRV
jgi:putative phage-type endonuclease